MPVTMTNEEAIKELQESHDMIRSYAIDESESRLMTALEMAIKALEHESKTGYWIKRPYGFKCSRCFIVHSQTSIFCPSCGAKMIEPQESEV